MPKEKMSGSVKKRCALCGMEKELRNFFRNSSSSDGYHSRCKVCFNVAPKNPRKWTKEKILRLAQRYTSKTEFWKNNAPAYNASLKMGVEFHSLCCSHMSGNYTLWDDESLEAEARQYATEYEFRLLNLGAYWSARRRGDAFFDKVTSHQAKANFKTDANALYLYDVKEHTGVFKIGVTSLRNRFIRISQVLAAGDLSISRLWYWNVDDAFALERKILSFGKEVNFDNNFDGSTEFRYFLEEEINSILSMMQGYKCLNNGFMSDEVIEEVTNYVDIFGKGSSDRKARVNPLSVHKATSNNFHSHNLVRYKRKIFGLRFNASENIWIVEKGKKSSRFKEKFDAVLAALLLMQGNDYSFVSHFAELRRLDARPSKSKGIYWREERQKWKVVSPKLNGKQVTIGYFADLDDAKDALNAWLREHSS